jgi:hypothetical protein
LVRGCLPGTLRLRHRRRLRQLRPWWCLKRLRSLKPI